MALDLSMLDGPAPSWSALPGVAAMAPLAAFDEDADNPRFEEEDAGEFEALVAELRERGILQPLVVRRLPSGRLQIRFGSRRFRAARCAGLAAAPYVVTEDERQFDDYAQVAENARRKDLQPLELATFIARKLAQGERKKTVAARLHLDASAVTHLLALADDPPPFLMELYHGRRCRSPQYLYELRKLHALQPQLVEGGLAEGGEVDRRALAALSAAVEAALALVGDDDRMAPAAALDPAAPAASLPVAAGSAPGAAPIRRPGLFAVYDGREVLLVLRRRPSAAGRVWVCCDGEDVELSFDDLRLCRLEDLAGARLRRDRTAGGRAAALSMEGERS